MKVLNFRQEERSTKWDKIQGNDSFGLVASVAGFLTSFGTVSDVINLANDGYKWFLYLRMVNSSACEIRSLADGISWP